MNTSLQINPTSSVWDNKQEIKKTVQLHMYPDPCSPDIIVSRLAQMDGPIDIYCWFEGPQCLPKKGANFMKQFIFEPLYKKKLDVKFYLYSLKAWNFIKNITTMDSSTDIGEVINRINQTFVECIYSSSFFQYSASFKKENNLYEFLNEELPKKKWLVGLSENQKKKGITIAELFNNQVSLFDCIKELDVSTAYSTMQYVEGYYLIRESVRKKLLNEQKKIQIAVVLPNDESKYYLDYSKDIEKMLRLDFAEKLLGIEIKISFQFFRYGDSLFERPYIDKRKKALTIKAKDIISYFDYLSLPKVLANQSYLFLRDSIHYLND